MFNKNIYINIIIRSLLIVGTSILFAFSIISKKPFVILNHTALIIIQLLLLIRYLNKTNYEIAKMFDSFRDNDFSTIISNSTGSKSQRKLNESLNNFISLLKESQIENITKSQELYAAIENIGTGLIWFTDDGQIKLLNKATKELLSIKSLRNISELDYINKSFSKLLKEIKPSQQRVIKLFINDEPLHIAIKASVMVQRNNRIKLISLQNIKIELDEAELDSWQKLIRVLAHEIMNSIGPITTSTTAISRYLKNDRGEAIDLNNMNKSIIDNTIKGLEIIEDRSVGLKDFVSRYRQLSNLPKPIISGIQLDAFIGNIGLLLKEELQESKIGFNYDIKPINLVLHADEKLISHVIINLLKNSIEAIQTSEKPIIDLNIFENEHDEIIIQISDNGSGIPQEIIDKIFIPFFTTKDEGSGIGLSLSRQIMRLHNGSINVKSSEEGAVFQLVF